ncbi:hypothetical protein BHE74_00027824 [Ensete ventricosum]|nr:hypothetical protein BHE74_00027824 [Ensete ventricosum]
MDITNSERLHIKDNGPLQTEVPTSVCKTHLYLQAKIDHKANQTRAAKPTASPLLDVQENVQHRILPTSFLGRALLHNPKSLAFGYLDEKLIDTDLMKFLGLCPSALSWYFEFASAFFTSSLHESKGSMTPRKSHLCSTIALPSPWSYYPLLCICIHSFAIGRSAFVALL